MKSQVYESKRLELFDINTSSNKRKIVYQLWCFFLTAECPKKNQAKEKSAGAQILKCRFDDTEYTPTSAFKAYCSL